MQALNIVRHEKNTFPIGFVDHFESNWCNVSKKMVHVSNTQLKQFYLSDFALIQTQSLNLISMLFASLSLLNAGAVIIVGAMMKNLFIYLTAIDSFILTKQK